jgi:hypothetical protein
LSACTYLRRGIAANPYIAEGLTGRMRLNEHLYVHWTNLVGSQCAADYLASDVCDWKSDEIDFVDWVFNASPVLKERAERMALNEALSFEPPSHERSRLVKKHFEGARRITDTVSKKMVRKVPNRRGEEVWPWDRTGLLMKAAT